MALRSQTPRPCSSSHETKLRCNVWFKAGSNCELTITVLLASADELIVQLPQRLVMKETVTSAAASSAMPCSVELRTSKAAFPPSRSVPPRLPTEVSVALFSATLQHSEQSATSKGPCTANRARRQGSMGEESAHSLHTLTSRREFASLSVPPVSSSAATCRAAAGSSAQRSAACNCKGRSNLRHPLPARSDPYAFLGNRPASPLRPQRRNAAPTADGAHRSARGVDDRAAVELQCACAHGSDGAAPLRMRSIPGSDDSAHENTDSMNAFIALTTCQPCTTTALDRHVRHEMAGVHAADVPPSTACTPCTTTALGSYVVCL
jgi:hypothetical protein